MEKFTTVTRAKKITGLSYLGNINISSKLTKNKKVSGHYTYCIYLAPAKKSGYNVCPYSTPECRGGCLEESGRAGMEISAGKTKTQACRIKKTRLFIEETAFFMAWMIAEMKSFKAKAEKEGFGFSARLNGTSDIDWSLVFVDGKNIFNIFPDVMFYDYTKNPNKFFNKPENYHLTFSYTGRNANVCKALLNQGYNVAVVFDIKKSKPLPATFDEYQVIDGDLTDFRPDDAKSSIIGLRWKNIANKEREKLVKESPFVVKANQNVLETSKELMYV